MHKLCTLLLVALPLTGLAQNDWEAGQAEAAGRHADREVFLPGVISTGKGHESLNWLSDTRSSAVFTRADDDFSRSEIFLAERRGAAWNVERLGFSTSGYDMGVSFAPETSSLLFTSTRPIRDDGEENWNVWSVGVEKETFSFGVPEPLPPPVNTGASECCAVFVSAEAFLFASDRGGNWDIFMAVSNGDEYEVMPLPGEVNSDFGEWPSYVSPGGDLLLFSSIRPNGMGGDDVYVSRKRGSAWGKPVILPLPVNTAEYEDNAMIHGGVLYWSSRNTPTGPGSGNSDVFALRIDGSGLDRLEERAQ